MKRGRLIVVLAALLLTLGAGWFFGSPLLTLRAMQSAAGKGDAAALSAHIDYPALREDVKRQVAEHIASQDLSTIERVLASRLAGSAVDVIVTEEGLRAMFLAAPLSRRSEAPPGGLRAADMTLRYDGLDQFRLVRKDGGDGELVFRRHGLGWKLSGIGLPKDFAGGT